MMDSNHKHKFIKLLSLIAMEPMHYTYYFHFHTMREIINLAYKGN